MIVPDYQLSLAIGKEGQNARLAARLTGWRIDIRVRRGDSRPPSGSVPREATRRVAGRASVGRLSIEAVD